MRAKNLEKKGKGNQKKAVSNVIAVVLLVMIVILLMIIVWNVIKLQIKNAQDDNDVRTQLLVEQATIDYADLSDPNMVNITITKGSGKIVLVNESEVNVPVTADIVSVVDLSSSMGDSWAGECKMNTSSTCCSSNNNCSDASNCSSCYGIFQNSICFANNTCSTNKASCTGVGCARGVWRNKLTLAQEANREFILNFLSILGNKIGFVGFGAKVYDAPPNNYSIPLTSNLTLLNSTINSWNNGSGTCICCGINKAITYLSGSASAKKVIVFMGDGGARYYCNPAITSDPYPYTIATKQAIDSAEDAWKNHSIQVYTIGLGAGDAASDFATLGNMSLKGNGTYYHSDTSWLSSVYDQVYTEIIKTYDEEKKIAYIKVMFYDLNGKSWEYRILGSDAPGPLETRTYSINMTGSELGKIEKIKIYPVAVTASGKYVIGPVLDVINFD